MVGYIFHFFVIYHKLQYLTDRTHYLPMVEKEFRYKFDVYFTEGYWKTMHPVRMLEICDDLYNSRHASDYQRDRIWEVKEQLFAKIDRIRRTGGEKWVQTCLSAKNEHFSKQVNVPNTKTQKA